MKIRSIDHNLGRKYDLALAISGYESRSRYFFETGHLEHDRWDKLLVVSMGGPERYDQLKNREYFSSIADIEASSDDSELRDALSREITEIASCKTDIFILVDISSMTRKIIALVVSILDIQSRQTGTIINAEFVYCAAEYTAPPIEFGSVRFKGPVIPYFSGWQTDLDKSNSLILGIGYEPDVALGLIEELEPQSLSVFCPLNLDPRYKEAVELANDWIFEEPLKDSIIYYRMDDPIYLFELIISAYSGAAVDFRPVVVPFGPKIFALVAALAALVMKEKISLWRVSSGEIETPANRIASGEVIRFQFSFTR